jgi:hypothetical protein
MDNAAPKQSAAHAVRPLRLSQKERRLLCLAINSAIENQTALIAANHDSLYGMPIRGTKGYIRTWRAEIRAWKKLKAKLSAPDR